MENNDLYGWGYNNFGQSKGDGTISISSPFNSTPFLMKSNVEQIEVGASSCFVFRKEGVYVCGYNGSGGMELSLTMVYETLTLNKKLKNIKTVENYLMIPKLDTKKQIFDIIIYTK